MTEPVRIKIGHVSFRQKDIKSYSVNFQNDEKINSVLLNNGTKITFKIRKQEINLLTAADYVMAKYII